jgi:hypothetical protein
MSKALRALGRLPPENPIPGDDATLIVKPREDGLQAKEIPVGKFLAKVVAMRDKLRVLEQRVNASGISVDEKIGLEADITQLYQAIATLTAFFSEDALGSPDEGGE